MFTIYLSHIKIVPKIGNPDCLIAIGTCGNYKSDRETYSFWEHLFKCSSHKTHEEAQFLMDTRCMLYLENGDTLDIFKVIPRKWMEDGKKIQLHNVVSYFGRLNFYQLQQQRFL